MFGISTSVFNEVGGLVKGWLKNPLNQSFFYWYFLPALGLVLLQLFVVGPALGYPPPDIFNIEAGPSESAIDLILQVVSASFFTLLLLPLIIGIVLSSLSGAILRLYQGTLPVARGLYRPWLKRNQRRSRQIYGPLQARRREYLFLASQGVRLATVDGQERGEAVPENEREALVEQLKREIQALHEGFEATAAARELPVDLERVAPNDLGNVLAVAEEYPFERYGIDAAVFWPRLRVEIEPDRLESLDTSFAAMSGLLNLSLLGYLFALEVLLVGAALLAGWIAPVAGPYLPAEWLLVAAPISLVVGLGAYRAAVGAATSVGNALRTAFDYYRGRVLERFNLMMPDDIEQERVVWLKLAAFIRRGESFYYPSEYRGSGKKDEE